VPTYNALVEADCIFGGIEADSKEDAEELLKQSVSTGDLGPASVRVVEDDE